MQKLKPLLQNYIFIFNAIRKSNRWILGMAIVSTITVGFVPIAASILLKDIIMALEILYKTPSSTDFFTIMSIMWLIIFYIGIFLLRDIITTCRIAVYRISALSLAYNIQSQIVDKIKNLEYYMFFDSGFQNLYALVLRSCDSEPMSIMQSTLLIVSVLIELIGRVGILICFNPWLVLLLGLSFLPNIICKLKFRKSEIKVWEEQIQNNRYNNYYFGLVTDKEATKEIREYGLFEYFSTKRAEKYWQTQNAWNNFCKREVKAAGGSQLIAKLGIFLTIVFLMHQVSNKQCSIAEFIFYCGTVISFQDIYGILIENLASHYSSMLFMDKFFKFMQTKEMIKNGLIPPKNSNHHVLEFKNVWFKYRGTNNYALKDVSCKFSTGDKVCIVGQNGCGKTTLVNMILRTYDPIKGEILLDGINIKEYDVVEYRNLFREIRQNYTRYAMPIDECIKIGNINANSELKNIKLAAKQANANEFIEELDFGYKTVLTKIFDRNGAELSSGQWQKLSVARVFFSGADILIFDEPTSALDPESEAKIYEEIEKTEPTKLKIFISHRMYTSKGATKIVMMHNGEILDIGTHEELMKRNQNYKKIFNIQAQKYN